MHEDFTRKETVQGSSDRSFGLVMAGFFGIVALWPLLHGSLSSIRWWALIVAVAFLAGAVLRPVALGPLHRLLLKLGLLLSKVVSPVVLTILFYTTVTPIGFLMRWSGKDPLRLRRNGAAQSYWILREPPGPTPDSM